MIAREKPLSIGGRVFDCLEHKCVRIVEFLERGMVRVESEDAGTWLTDDGNLYQFVPDMVDTRCEEPVCYEHEDEIDYPYYSPYLDENLYGFEIKEA